MKRALALAAGFGVAVVVIIDWSLDRLNAHVERRLSEFAHPLDSVLDDDSGITTEWMWP